MIKKPIATVSHTLSLEKLANIITEIFNLPKVKVKINKDLPENIYTNKSDEYLKILKCFKIEPKKMNYQIKETYKALLCKR